MLAPTNNSSRKTAPPQPGTLNRKRPQTPPISMITFFNLFSFPALAGCLSALFCLVFCQRSTEPLEKALPEQEFTLTVESAEVTGVWLKLQAQPLDERISYLVQRGDTHTVFSGKLVKNDTILHDFNLQPARDYEYKAYRLVDGHKLPPPVIVTTTTMDTTSHDFTWQIFEFGGKGSSAFYDVAIIDENNIWAVGEIYTAETYTYDSLGNWIGRHNAVHWDGQKWELKRVPYIYEGKPFHHPLRFVFSFDEEVWFGGNGIVKLRGQTFSNVEIPLSAWGNVAINKAFGFKNKDVYIIGDQGHIAHYDGQSWRRIESGTTENIQDIWGCLDIESGKLFVLCTASQTLRPSEKLLLNIQMDGVVQKEYWPFENNNIYSVWFRKKEMIFTCGGGLYLKRLYQSWFRFVELPKIHMNRLRGNEINDLFVAGDFGLLYHFNGMTWTSYTSFYEIDTFLSLDIKNDLIISVGENKSKAVIYMGKR